VDDSITAEAPKHLPSENKSSPRGETLVVINGEEFKMRFSLGAMAMLEKSLGLKNIAELQEALQNPSMGALEKIAICLIRGGGEKVSDDFFMTAEVDLADLSKAIGTAVALAFPNKNKTEEEPTPGN